MAGNEETKIRAIIAAEGCSAVLVNYTVAQAQDGVLRLTMLEEFATGEVIPRTCVCMGMGTVEGLVAVLQNILKQAAQPFSGKAH